MRWIVGLDVRPRTAGAIRAATWLAARSREVGTRPLRLVGVHVVPRAPRVGERDDIIDETCARARSEADAVVRTHAAAEAFERIDAVPGVAADVSLAAAAEYYDADGIIVGRAAPADTTAIIRLGSVARRLVRGLPRPVMIVPPDYDPRGADGPVVLATDLKLDASAAGRYALQLAREIGRDLEVVHVAAPLAFRFAGESMRPPAADSPEMLEPWLERYGLGGATARRLQGDAAEQLIDHASASRAAMIVAGSRQLSGFDRVFQSSTGIDLARYANCPVVVVPPAAIVRWPG